LGHWDFGYLIVFSISDLGFRILFFGGLPLSYEFLYHVLQFSMELANLAQTINE